MFLLSISYFFLLIAVIMIHRKTTVESPKRLFIGMLLKISAWLLLVLRFTLFIETWRITELDTSPPVTQIDTLLLGVLNEIEFILTSISLNDLSLALLGFGPLLIMPIVIALYRNQYDLLYMTALGDFTYLWVGFVFDRVFFLIFIPIYASLLTLFVLILGYVSLLVLTARYARPVI